jgi:hypothetical protein
MNKYLSILKLEVRHEYFTSGLCTGLIFAATPKTENLIKNYRLRVKYLPAGLEVFAPLDGNDKPFIPIEEPLVFQWLLQAKSDDFFIISDLPEKDRVGQYRISNDNVKDNFKDYGGLFNETEKKEEGSFVGLVESFTGKYVLNEGLSEHVVKLDQLPALNANLNEFRLENDLNDDTVTKSKLKVKSFNRETGELSLKANKLPSKKAVKITYPVAVKGDKNAFALMELTLNKATGVFYTLNFKAKKQQWQYLILTDKKTVLEPAGSWRLNSADKAFPQGIIVKELNKNTAPESGRLMAGLIWERLKSRIDFDNEKAYFLNCKNPLPIKEKPITDLVIQKGKESDSWEDIITDIPSPTFQDHGIRLIVNPIIS